MYISTSKTHAMKYLLFFLSVTILISCKEPQLPEGLAKHTQMVNEGFEVLIREKLNGLNNVSNETGLLKQAAANAWFYRTNTYFLINGDTKQPDSLIYWRLTKTKAARQLNFQPDLDSSIVFGGDSLMRKTVLLYNLHEYILKIYQSFSYCGVIYGSIPRRDSKDTSQIHLYGIPPKGSVLSHIAEYGEYSYPKAIDTIPVWATLTIHPINDSTN